MIYVTQGHEDSIALEVFFKSLLLLPKNSLNEFCLVANKKVLEKNLKDLSYDFSINDNFLNLFDRKLAISEVNSNISDSSFFSIKQSLEVITKDDVLVTLPTSKDKFIENGKQFAGHTDYFRHVYPEHPISMNFVSEYEKITLLTDHVPLVKVPDELKTNNFGKNIAEAINQYNRFFQNEINKVLICGINPHAGESGLIGSEDSIIEDGIKKLKTQFPHIEFSRPLPGDTILLGKNDQQSTLYVYTFHDQALSSFKSRNRFIGVNISFAYRFLV